MSLTLALLEQKSLLHQSAEVQNCIRPYPIKTHLVMPLDAMEPKLAAVSWGPMGLGLGWSSSPTFVLRQYWLLDFIPLFAVSAESFLASQDALVVMLFTY